MTIGRRAFFIFLAFVCILEKTLFILTFGHLNLSLEMKIFNKYAKKESKLFSPKRKIKWKTISENEIEISYENDQGELTIIGKTFRKPFSLKWNMEVYFFLPNINMMELDETFDSEIEAGRRIANLWEINRDYEHFNLESFYDETIY